MNTIGIIIIALLLVALVVAVCRWRDLSVELAEACHRAAAARNDAAHERKNAAEEEERADGLLEQRFRLEKTNVEQRDKILELSTRTARKPARFVLDGGMTEEQIERALAGSSGSPVVRAIVAHLTAKLVRDLDTSTDVPREMITTPERVIEGYTTEMRLHDAGGASHLAELLAELQSLTAAKAAEEEKPATAA